MHRRAGQANPKIITMIIKINKISNHLPVPLLWLISKTSAVYRSYRVLSLLLHQLELAAHLLSRHLQARHLVQVSINQ